MSLLRVSVCTLPFALVFGCASKPAPMAPMVEAPNCEPEPVIVVNDPEPPRSFVSIPVDTELVSLRLFVVSQGDGPTDESLPPHVRESDLCRMTGCSLLLSPMLLGRNRSTFELEVGNGKTSDVLAMKATPRVVEDHIDLRLEARFMVGDDQIGQRFAFAGTLEPGEITHVGTFYSDVRRERTVGPQVFAVVDRAVREAE